MWLQQGIIEEAASQWSFPLVSVAKKCQAGQTVPQYRFCADLRVLNSKVLADGLFTGSVPANLALLEQHKIYTALDLWNAFESCELEPSSRDFFSFSSPLGSQYRYKRLTQGFCNSPTTTPRRKPLLNQPPINNSGCLSYVDDLLAYSLTLTDHINLLHILFHRIKEANCRLKTNKCFIARDQIQYLGYTVGADGM